jgi:hypothetical protein
MLVFSGNDLKPKMSISFKYIIIFFCAKNNAYASRIKRENLLAKSFQLLAESRLRREGLPSGKPLFTYLGAVYHKINKDAIGSVEKWAGHYILR